MKYIGLACLTVAVLGAGAIVKWGPSVEEKVQLVQAQQTAQVLEQVSKVEAEVIPARIEAKTRIQTVTKEIIREVPVYVPAGSCSLPPGFRLLHDAAAAGEVPQAASQPDATPVDPQSAAATIAQNYGACHDNADQLRRLQQWIEGVSQ